MPSHKQQYDLIVIGSGSAGEGAIDQADPPQRSIAIVEKDRVGGDCPNYAFMPTKALLRSAKAYSLLIRADAFGLSPSAAKLDWSRVMAGKEQIVRSTGEAATERRYRQEDIVLCEGTAALEDEPSSCAPSPDLGKVLQARVRLTPGAKKLIISIDDCFTVVSQVGFLSGTLAAHRRSFIRAGLQLYLHCTGIVDTQPYPNPTGLNGEAAQSFLESGRRHYGNREREGCVSAMFDNILVPLDRSVLAECVLPHAVAIARAFQSQVTLLTVLERGTRLDSTFGVDPLEWRIRKAEAESYLRNLSDRLQNTGLPLKRRTLEGEAAEQVIDFAHNNGMNLIILSSHGQSGLTGWNVGSVVQKIVMRARTSIMIVRAYQRRSTDLADLHYERLLVPMDGSHRAEWVWPLATTLARAQGAEILLAHVVKPPEMPRRLPPTSEDTELADRVVTRNQEEARRYVDELRSWMPSSVRGYVLVGDHVPATLHQLAEQEGVDLVVLSAHGYSGGTRFLYGGVAISFIIYGNTPVLIVQDVPKDQIQPNPAEIRATDHGVLPMPHGTFDIEDSWQSISTGSLATIAVSSPTDLPLISASKTARPGTFVPQTN